MCTPKKGRSFIRSDEQTSHLKRERNKHHAAWARPKVDNARHPKKGTGDALELARELVS